MRGKYEKENKLKINRQTSVPSIVKTTYGGDWVSHYYERHQGFLSGLLVAIQLIKKRLEAITNQTEEETERIIEKHKEALIKLGKEE